MSEEASLVDLYDRYLQGDTRAEELLFRLLYDRLLPRVRRLLGDRLRLWAASGDIVVSALASFVHGAQGSRPYRFDHSGALWKLLVQIAVNKIRRAAQKAKRAGGELPPTNDLPDPVDACPGPEDVAILADLIRAVLDGLPPRCGDVLRYKLAEYSVMDIATMLRVSRWTVTRDNDRIRLRLERFLQAGLETDSSSDAA